MARRTLWSVAPMRSVSRCAAVVGREGHLRPVRQAALEQPPDDLRHRMRPDLDEDAVTQLVPDLFGRPALMVGREAGRREGVDGGQIAQARAVPLDDAAAARRSPRSCPRAARATGCPGSRRPASPSPRRAPRPSGSRSWNRPARRGRNSRRPTRRRWAARRSRAAGRSSAANRAAAPSARIRGCCGPSTLENSWLASQVQVLPCGSTSAASYSGVRCELSICLCTSPKPGHGGEMRADRPARAAVARKGTAGPTQAMRRPRMTISWFIEPGAGMDVEQPPDARAAGRPGACRARRATRSCRIRTSSAAFRSRSSGSGVISLKTILASTIVAMPSA